MTGPCNCASFISVKRIRTHLSAGADSAACSSFVQVATSHASSEVAGPVPETRNCQDPAKGNEDLGNTGGPLDGMKIEGPSSFFPTLGDCRDFSAAHCTGPSGLVCAPVERPALSHVADSKDEMVSLTATWIDAELTSPSCAQTVLDPSTVEQRNSDVLPSELNFDRGAFVPGVDAPELLAGLGDIPVSAAASDHAGSPASSCAHTVIDASAFDQLIADGLESSQTFAHGAAVVISELPVGELAHSDLLKSSVISACDTVMPAFSACVNHCALDTCLDTVVNDGHTHFGVSSDMPVDLPVAIGRDHRDTTLALASCFGAISAWEDAISDFSAIDSARTSAEGLIEAPLESVATSGGSHNSVWDEDAGSFAAEILQCEALSTGEPPVAVMVPFRAGVQCLTEWIAQNQRFLEYSDAGRLDASFSVLFDLGHLNFDVEEITRSPNQWLCDVLARLAGGPVGLFLCGAKVTHERWCGKGVTYAAIMLDSVPLGTEYLCIHCLCRCDQCCTCPACSSLPMHSALCSPLPRVGLSCSACGTCLRRLCDS